MAGKISGIKSFVSKNRRYIYHRRSRTRIRAEFGSDKFYRELEAIERTWADYPKDQFTEHLLGSTFLAFLTSERFASLPLRIRSNARRAVRLFGSVADMPLQLVDREQVSGLRDHVCRRYGPRFANIMVVLIVEMLHFAVDQAWLQESPVTLQQCKLRRCIPNSYQRRTAQADRHCPDEDFRSPPQRRWGWK